MHTKREIAEVSYNARSKRRLLNSYTRRLATILGVGLAFFAGPLHAEFLFITDADDAVPLGNSVSAYRIAENGTLKSIGSFPTGKWPGSVVVDRVGKFLFTANMGDDTVSVYRIGFNGVLTRLPDSNAGMMPAALAVDPFGRFLYVTNLDGSGIPGYGGTVGHVSVCRIGSNGTLTPVPGSPFPAGFSPLAVKADPLGRFVYVGNAGSQEEFTETVSGYRVGGNGTLTPLTGSPFPDGESPWAMAVDPFGRFLYTAGEYDLGLLTNRIAANGALTNLANSSFRTGAGFQPWNAVVADPLGRFIYQSTSGYNPASGTLSVFRVGPKGLNPGSHYVAGFFVDSMVVNLSGEYLYGAVSAIKGTLGPIRGTGVAAYRINGNGALKPITGSPFLVGLTADSIAISP